MGVAVTFVLTLASLITWLLQTFVLEVWGISYLQTIAFILVIASLVQFVEMVMEKHLSFMKLWEYISLITTNCAVLGVAILNIQKSYGWLATLANSLGNALGFTLALILLRELGKAGICGNSTEFKGSADCFDYSCFDVNSFFRF